jgi:molybdopterin converting factor small subunit
LDDNENEQRITLEIYEKRPPMKVQLSLYASLSRYLPEGTNGKSCSMEIEGGATVKEILNQLQVPMNTVKIIFLNGVHATGDAVLKDGDRLGVFPPVAGG